MANISQIKLPDGTSYTIKDSVARAQEIGGRNLLKHTRTFADWWFHSTAKPSSVDEDGCTVVSFSTNDTTAWREVRNNDFISAIPYALLKGNTVTFSFWAKSADANAIKGTDSTQSLDVIFALHTNTSVSRTKYTPTKLAFKSSISTAWQKFSCTIEVADSIFSSGTGTINTTDYFFVQLYNHTQYRLDVKKLKLEFGDKATDWSPAPEDLVSGGGRNLYKDSNAPSLVKRSASADRYFSGTKPTGYAGTWVSISNPPEDGILYGSKEVSTTDTTAAYNAVATGENIPLVEGKEYTVSCWAKADAAGTCYIEFQMGSSPYMAVGLEMLDTKWRKYSATFAYRESAMGGGGAGCRAYIGKRTIAGVASTAYFCGFKVEEGAIATSWCPAVEDGFTELLIQSKTTASNAYDSENPKIIFKNNGGDQNGQLIWTDYDSVQSPASLTLIGNQGNEYFIAPQISTSKKYAGYWLLDSTGKRYPGVYDNGANLWIGSDAQTSSKHHVGSTYISTGINSTTNVGNSTIGIVVPDGEGGATSYAAFHTGYLDVSKATAGTLPIGHGGTGGADRTAAANSLQVASLGHGTAIGANSDLNSIMTLGNYHCAANTTVATLTNKPSNLAHAFTMKVGYGTGTGYTCQEISRYYDGARWYRYYDPYDEVWEEWVYYAPFTGIKGNAESSYRTGSVNLTPANIGALALSGGTLTGNLNIKKSGVTIGTTTNNGVSSGTVYSQLIVNDTANAWYTVIGGLAKSTGEVSAEIKSKNKKTDGTEVENVFNVGVKKDGTRYYSVSDEAAFRTAIDAAASSHTHSYLPLSGGTLTGGINLDKSSVTIGTTSNNGVSSGTIYSEIKYRDSADYWYSIVGADANADGDTWINVKARNKKTDGTEVSNAINIGVKKDGTQYYSVSNASAFRTAISAAAASHTHSYLPLSGGTLTGTLTSKADVYGDDYTTGGINLNNSDIVKVNALYTADASGSATEGIHFYRDATHVDTLWIASGAINFVPNRELGTSTTAANSQKVGRFTATPTTGQVVVTDGTTGGMKSSGYTIAKSVPSNANFSNTWTAMTGATATANGKVGYVNAVPPMDGYNSKFLRADGTWTIPNTINSTVYITDGLGDQTSAIATIMTTMTSINISKESTGLPTIYASTAGPGMKWNTYGVELHEGSFVSTTNNNLYLGTNTLKWKSVYAVTGTIQTSDRNKKKDISYNMDQYVELFDKLKPASYKFIDGESGRTHTGLIAQDVEDAIIETDLTSKDLAAFIKDKDEDGSDSYGLRYDEFIAILIAKIKQQEERIGQLEELNGI